METMTKPASFTPVLTIQFKSSWFHRLAHPQRLWKLLRLCWLWSLSSAAVSALATAVVEDQTFKWMLLLLLLLLQLQICWRGISTIKSYDLKSVHYTSTSVSLEVAKGIHIGARVCVYDEALRSVNATQTTSSRSVCLHPSRHLIKVSINVEWSCTLVTFADCFIFFFFISVLFFAFVLFACTWNAIVKLSSWELATHCLYSVRARPIQQVRK